MAQDKTNIFKLSEKELKEYKTAPFFDCMPGAENFAESLKTDILTKETPYVLLLEKNYGMGKTYFSTRFAQYLRNDSINTVYFSAWENDYLPDPFLSFSKELQKYFHNINLKTRAFNAFDKVTTSTKKLTTNIIKATQISIGINAAAQASVTIDNEKIATAVEELFNDFKKEKDSVQEFKEELSNFINKLPKKKLVLIIDELDRCRPDYAMKVLEIIKHFFDIEGLFVIVPTNQPALETSLEALYGIKSKERNQNCENYFKKFFNQTQKISEPDYIKMVKDYVKPEYLLKSIEAGYISDNGNKFNSLEVLINSLADYGKKAQLSLREMTHACKEIIHICNHFCEEEIRLEYFAYLISLEECKKKNNNNGEPRLITLNKEHPYFQQIAYGSRFDNHTETEKNKILNLSNYKNSIYQFNRYDKYSYREYHHFRTNFLNEYKNNNCTFKTYSEIKSFINNQIKLLAESNKNQYLPINKHVDELNGILKEKEKEIYQYQEKYGSDDNDQKRQDRYKEIIEKRETLYKNGS